MGYAIAFGFCGIAIVFGICGMCVSEAIRRNRGLVFGELRSHLVFVELRSRLGFWRIAIAFWVLWGYAIVFGICGMCDARLGAV
jgi:hypothetical protein